MSTDATDKVRAVYDLTGIVQGVGFRPAIFRLATSAGLSGSVQNRSGVVRLTLEGPDRAVSLFITTLPDRIPHAARIDSSIEVERTMLSDDVATPFTIATSDGADTVDVVIPADLAMCGDCQREILDPDDRRYGYAFTTCTACGPRYTVVNGMPYDRERTTMSVFPMCKDCLREYVDPMDRRFHSETTACQKCGPQLTLRGHDTALVKGDPLPLTRAALRAGKIAAIRGIGGFLLACDAFNRDALSRLRKRKHRPHKPLALMARDMSVVSRFCDVPPEAATLLLSKERPIVVLDVAAGSPSGLPLDVITPDANTVGVMLPTSPLHTLLFEPLEGDHTPPLDLLVMTSGNKRGEPICITDDEAFDRLAGIADIFLTHNREINLRNDDSLFAMQLGQPQVWRRARGYAPEPVRITPPLDRIVLATGAELKNSIALGYGGKVVLSPHVGDLETPEANDGFDQVVRCLPQFLDKQPDVVAVDLHPDMHSSQVGRRIARAAAIPLIEVQHHHAHAAACLAEHGRQAGLALVLDGTGLGTDGTIWGAEMLEVEGGSFRRLATFASVPLPGGDAAISKPVRQLAGRWSAAGVTPSGNYLHELGLTTEEAAVWQQQCRGNVNAPMTHAAGRLFDAFSAALGIPPVRVTYEGQAAIRLEAIAETHTDTLIPDVPFDASEAAGMLCIDWSNTFRQLADKGSIPAAHAPLAMGLHRAIAQACAEMVEYGFSHSKHRCVGLSGGVFMNRLLTRLLVPKLESMGAEVLVHRDVPPNDGCIALGQAVIAGRS